MTTKDKPLKMPDQLLVLTFSESSMSQLPLPLLMVSTRRVMVKDTSLSLIWEEEHSMFLSWPSIKVCLKSRLQPVTPIWEDKILITKSLNIVVPISWRKRDLILETTQEPWEDLELNAKRQREFSHLQLKQLSKLTHWPNLKISHLLLPELNSKNYAWACSNKLSHQ